MSSASALHSTSSDISGFHLALASGHSARILIFGNNRYPFMTRGDIDDDPANNAQLLYDTFAKMGYIGTLIINSTLEVMRAAVSTFVASMRDGDQVVIAYNGRGCRVDDQQRTLWLLPSDYDDGTALSTSTAVDLSLFVENMRTRRNVDAVFMLDIKERIVVAHSELNTTTSPTRVVSVQSLTATPVREDVRLFAQTSILTEQTSAIEPVIMYGPAPLAFCPAQLKALVGRLCTALAPAKGTRATR